MVLFAVVAPGKIGGTMVLTTSGVESSVAPKTTGKLHKSQVAIDLPLVLPCVRKGSNTRKNLAFQQLHGSTTTSATVGDFVHCVVFLARGGSVTTTNDGDGTLFGCSDDGVHECFRAGFEFAHL